MADSMRVLTDEFTERTGCTLKTKDGTTGDEMITLIQSGEYDGVSASGHTSVRLMEAGDVAPVNPDLLPNYADIAEGIKLKSYNSKDGEPYGGPHGRGPNYLMFRTDEVDPPADSWSVIFDTATPYKGKLSDVRRQRSSSPTLRSTSRRRSRTSASRIRTS